VPACTPTLLQNQGPSAGKYPKIINFGLHQCVVGADESPEVEQKVHKTLYFGKGIDFVERRLATS